MPNLGVWEVDVILVLVLAILVVGRLPEVGVAAGKRLRRFRRAPINRPAQRAPVVPAPAARVTGAQLADAAPAVVVENRCPSCSTVNPTAQVFCGQCGTRLGSTAPGGATSDGAT